MIENDHDLQNFISENQSGDLILHVVPDDELKHPADNSPCIFFVKNIKTQQVYYLSISHSDSHSTVSKTAFCGILASLNSKKWTLDKKVTSYFAKNANLLDANLCGFFEGDEILTYAEYETSAHNLIRRNTNNIFNVNRIIPLMKHLESFCNMCEGIEKMISNFEIDDSFLLMNGVILETLGGIEKNGIFVDREKFVERFEVSPNDKGMVFSEYNIYTSTGRPSNRYGGINYAALNHSDGTRDCFVSRYGKDGKIILIDYTAFHPRIICSLIDYKISPDTNIYEYLARLYFKNSTIDDISINEAKRLTFRQLYGGVEEKYKHIKYFSNLNEYIACQWEFFNKLGYVETPFFNRKITTKHVLEPNPSKLFNYILQAVEGEIAIPRIKLVQELLKDKKSLPILYTYDSVLYDFHREDGMKILTEIQKIMSFDGRFPMKTYIGDSYQNIKEVNV